MGSKGGCTAVVPRAISSHPIVVWDMWWSLLRDVHRQPSPTGPEPATPEGDVLDVAKALVGARVRQSASHCNSIVFIGLSGCSKSSLISNIVGFPFSTVAVSIVFLLDMPLLSLCSHHVSTQRVRHQSGLSEPIIEIAIEAFHINLELLPQLGFTRQCSQWEVDENLQSIVHPEAPESFRRAWESGMLLQLDVVEMFIILERPDFELAAKTAGLDQVRKTVRTGQSAFSILPSMKVWLPRLDCSVLS